MKIKIEKNQTITEVIDLPQFFTTLTGWYYMVLPNDSLLHVTESGIGIYTGSACLRHVIDTIKPCSQDVFIEAYCRAINLITAASGVEHLPLELTGGAYAD